MLAGVLNTLLATALYFCSAKCLWNHKELLKNLKKHPFSFQKSPALLKEFCLAYIGHNQLIVWFASVLPQKMGRASGWKQRSLEFLKKKNNILPVS